MGQFPYIIGFMILLWNKVMDLKIVLINGLFTKDIFILPINITFDTEEIDYTEYKFICFGTKLSISFWYYEF
jgi:hypothetical protein